MRLFPVLRIWRLRSHFPWTESQVWVTGLLETMLSWVNYQCFIKTWLFPQDRCFVEVVKIYMVLSTSVLFIFDGFLQRLLFIWRFPIVWSKLTFCGQVAVSTRCSKPCYFVSLVSAGLLLKYILATLIFTQCAYLFGSNLVCLYCITTDCIFMIDN